MAARQCGRTSLQWNARLAGGIALSITLVTLLGTSSRGQEKASDAPRRLLLDEFRPKPQLRAPRQRITRAKFPCVNVHFHPEKLTASQLDEQVRVMDEGNVAVSVSL